jgi:hypothetical protein
VEYNRGCLGKFETAFDGEIKAIVNIVDYINGNEIPGDSTIHSDAQAAIARVRHTATALGKNGQLES